MEPSSWETQLGKDSEIKNAALKLAKLQAFKALYIKDIRHNPEKYLEGAIAQHYHALADSACEQKQLKHASCSIITYNIPHVSDELAIKFFRSMVRAMAKWNWIKGFAYVIELSPSKRRPHLHMVLHQAIKRYPSEIHRQIWVWAHNAYNTEHYPFVNNPKHTRKALNIRPILNGREGIDAATAYLEKCDEDILYGPYSVKDVTYLYAPKKPKEEKIDE